MATRIGVWQIVEGGLEALETSMAEAGRKETEDLERWIRSKPTVLAQDLLIIGEQVPTKAGRMDFLGIDKAGNLVVIELKRGKLPREALAQAVDYASEVASWDIEKVNEVCLDYAKQELNDCLNEKFEHLDLESLSINETQRLLLVGFSMDESLERMIEWLSNSYGVDVNAVVLRYIKTKGGDELLARTTIIPEEVVKDRTGKRRLQIEMSDEPGNYPDEELTGLLRQYLAEDGLTPKRVREVLLPLCLKYDVVTRGKMIEELIQRGEAANEGAAGYAVTSISRALGIKKRDYLRQIIQYDRDEGAWEKNNYRLAHKYKDIVKTLLAELNT